MKKTIKNQKIVYAIIAFIVGAIQLPHVAAVAGEMSHFEGAWASLSGWAIALAVEGLIVALAWLRMPKALLVAMGLSSLYVVAFFVSPFVTLFKVGLVPSVLMAASMPFFVKQMVQKVQPEQQEKAVERATDKTAQDAAKVAAPVATKVNAPNATKKDATPVAVKRSKKASSKKRKGMKLLQKGMTQTDVATQLKVHRSTVGRWVKEAA